MSNSNPTKNEIDNDRCHNSPGSETTGSVVEMTRSADTAGDKADDKNCGTTPERLLKRVHPSKAQLVRPNKRLAPRTNREDFQDVKPSYFWEGGLRHVRPYTFEYQTYAKERWLDRTLLEVLTREFRDRPPSYYQAAIRQQLITLNHQACQLDTRIRASDLLAHQLHRHEPPVSGEPVHILAEDKVAGLLVVNKPGSLPVHPSGRYRFNTLVEILRWERGYRHLSVINRLDRLTSGVCILATHPEAAERLHQQMEDRQLRKEYIARVAGIVPWERLICKEPLLVVEHKLGLVAVSPAGKAAHTEFIRLAVDDEVKGTSQSVVGASEDSKLSRQPLPPLSSPSTLLLCRPLTGRTHQIRVHLQHLGHPILNDTLYNHPIWRDEGGREVATEAGARVEIRAGTEHKSGSESEVGQEKTKPAAIEAGRLQKIAQQLLRETQEIEGNYQTSIGGTETDDLDPSIPMGDPTALCPECRQPPDGRTPNQLCIYLHAWKYSSSVWSYETDTLPAWAAGITPDRLRKIEQQFVETEHETRLS